MFWWKKIIWAGLLCLCLTAPLQAADLVLLALDNNSYIIDQSLNGLDLKKVDIKVVSAGELDDGGETLRREIDGAKVIIVDVMGRKLETYLLENINLKNKTIYALRTSIDDQRLQKSGFIFDDKVAEYYRHISKENIRNMLRFVAQRHFDSSITFSGVKKRPKFGLYHPDAGQIFTDVAAYQAWQQSRPGYDPKKPLIGLLFFSSYLTEGQKQPIHTVINRLETEGFNVLPCFGRAQHTLKAFILDPRGNSRVDLILAFSLKFYSALTPQLAGLIKQVKVPIINAIPLFKETIDQWRKSPVGIVGNEIAWSLATPEISGLIEPTPLAAKRQVSDPETGKSYFISEPIVENLERLLPRLKRWINLQRKPNREKKIALMFYNHSQGKQNIGASYLNVFASVKEIVAALDRDGYQVGPVPSEAEIKRLIMTSARNIGSWAPGELEKLMRSPEVVRVSLTQYKSWFETLPVDFQKNVIKQWGRPESAKIMRDGDDFIIPAVTVKNLILLPEPSRGWGDDPMKLYHDPSIYPHHQYLAVYLWLAHTFKADAMIHLGTHATYEWTPGKQAGLSPSCSPEVLINDIPSLYPYIVDDVGEGIQAKRRGRGVIISHLTPMLKEVDLYAEYARLAELINEYDQALVNGGVTAPEKFKEIMALALKTGIVADLKAEIKDDDPAASTVRIIEHYLDEINNNLLPYGLHTFGKSPAAAEIKAMSQAVVKWNPAQDKSIVSRHLSQSGPLEMRALLQGLKGRFIEPGPGNDPIRNPESLPGGRNFYGFNPQKLPTPAAWALGKKAAEEIIRSHLKKEKKYPDKVAVVLWATETLRNEGINESTILYLMGIKPKWSRTGRIMGVEVIPGAELKRPRIDVMVNASGLYRDLFSEKMEFIDQAVQLAIRQTDIENLIAANSRKIKTRLIKGGMDEKAATEMSRLRIFSAPPGAYGTGVSEMAGASGIWEDEKEVLAVYKTRIGYAFGRGQWGVPARAALSANLAGVEVAVHSRSSNVYGLLDNDDMFQYLGALSMAVRLESGRSPETLITQQQRPGQLNVEDMAKTLGREMRSRYLNPQWIAGMKKEDYAGAREMAHFVEYLWGWEMTTPDKVDDTAWQQSYEVYVEDKYDLKLKEFFQEASPWAYQSITARMLETVRKGYWQPQPEVEKKLAAEYAVSVVEKGVACCDHTCNNPLLNQMVVSIISLPGVMSPEMVEKFKLAIEQAAQKSLEKQVVDRKELQEKLNAPSRKSQPEPISEALKKPAKAGDGAETVEVEGYKMKEVKTADDSTQVTSSGVEWLAGLVVFLIIGLAVWGAKRKPKF